MIFCHINHCKLVGWVLWHINLCRLFNTKSPLFIYVKYMIWFGWVLWYINHGKLFNAKYSLYIYIKNIWFGLVGFYGISTIVGLLYIDLRPGRTIRVGGQYVAVLFGLYLPLTLKPLSNPFEPFQIKWEVYFSKELRRSSLLCRCYDSACICIWVCNNIIPNPFLYK